jgi:hypothetical protein
VPEDATRATLHIYSYPEEGSKDNEDSENIITRYDNFVLVNIPDVKDKYYYKDDLDFEIVNPREVVLEDKSDTKKLIHIKGATTSFFLVSNVVYNDGWRLYVGDKSNSVEDDYHFEIAGYKNGWYVDIDKLCGDDKCIKNEDGSYDMEMVMEYMPTSNIVASDSSCCFWNKILIFAMLLGYILWDMNSRKNKKEIAIQKRMNHIAYNNLK